MIRSRLRAGEGKHCQCGSQEAGEVTGLPLGIAFAERRAAGAGRRVTVTRPMIPREWRRRRGVVCGITHCRPRIGRAEQRAQRPCARRSPVNDRKNCQQEQELRTMRRLHCQAVEIVVPPASPLPFSAQVRRPIVIFELPLLEIDPAEKLPGYGDAKRADPRIAKSISPVRSGAC
jgi:hypothetical protein